MIVGIGDYATEIDKLVELKHQLSETAFIIL